MIRGQFLLTTSNRFSFLIVVQICSDTSIISTISNPSIDSHPSLQLPVSASISPLLPDLIYLLYSLFIHHTHRTTSFSSHSFNTNLSDSCVSSLYSFDFLMFKCLHKPTLIILSLDISQRHQFNSFLTFSKF